jgi:hypothetical protein
MQKQEHGKKVWSLLSRYKDPAAEVWVFQDDGDRRALSLAIGVCDTLMLEKPSTISKFPDESWRAEDKTAAPNPHIGSVTKASKSLVIGQVGDWVWQSECRHGCGWVDKAEYLWLVRGDMRLGQFEPSGRDSPAQEKTAAVPAEHKAKAGRGWSRSAAAWMSRRLPSESLLPTANALRHPATVKAITRQNQCRVAAALSLRIARANSSSTNRPGALLGDVDGAATRPKNGRIGPTRDYHVAIAKWTEARCLGRRRG